jgi:mannose-6-phosphate isomerase-like protein (cupin superfamily)
MLKISKKDAIQHNREGVNGTYYQLPDIEGGTTIAYAEFTGEHGERTIEDKARIYYILEGKGEFVINGKKFDVEDGDVIPVPPHSTYNLFPTSKVLKIILYCELLTF